MTFADIPNGASVFLDANTFVYDFLPDPLYGPPCRSLLERIQRNELFGFTSTHVLSDVAHRCMTLEAMQQFGWPVAGIARRLRRHPADVQTLTRFRQAVEAIPRIGVQVLTIAPSLISAAAIVSQQTGLLCGDALLVAVMRALGLSHLASHDADFDRVPGLTRYAPA